MIISLGNNQSAMYYDNSLGRNKARIPQVAVVLGCMRTRYMNRGSETDPGTIWDESREQKVIKAENTSQGQEAYVNSSS